MTHVMRWFGAARRAHETAVKHVVERTAFGGRLSDLGMVQQMIADNEIDLAATRALLLHACAELDSGDRASLSTSITKTFAAEALDRIADRATQLCGGLGVTADLPVAKIARELRPFRIYDGPSEVHRWAIARRSVRSIAGRPAMSDLTPRPTRERRPKAARWWHRCRGRPLGASAHGGRSNLTYVLTDGVSRWVLRRPPTAGGTPSAHDVAREVTVTRAFRPLMSRSPRPCSWWRTTRRSMRRTPLWSSWRERRCVTVATSPP